MEALLLKKNELNEILLLRLLKNEDKNTHYSTKEILARLDISHPTLLRLIKAIHTRLHKEDFILIDNNYISLDPKLTNKEVNEALYFIYQKTVSESYKANLLFLLVKNNNLSIDFLCQKLDMSQPYVKQLIGDINRFIKSSNVTIRLKNNVYHFTGESWNIFILTYNLDSYLSTIFEPISCQNPDSNVLTQITRYLNYNQINSLDYMKKHRLSIAYKQLLKLKDKFDTITISHPNVDQALSLMVEKNDLFSTELDTLSQNKNIRKLLNFFAQLQFTNNISQIELANYMLDESLKTNKLYTDSRIIEQFIVSCLPKDINLTVNDSLYLHYTIFILRISQELFPTDYVSLIYNQDYSIGFDLEDKDQTSSKVILKRLYASALIEKHPNVFKLLEDHCDLYVGILNNLIKTYTKRTLTIAIDLTMNPTTEFSIRKVLSEFFSQTKIQIVPNSLDVDLVISDNPLNYHPDQEFFYVYNSHEMIWLEQLVTFISSTYIKKISSI